ncbi:MAG: YbaY family lipoprotein [Shewanella xiamenensis]|uniref:YbaY family lipoprotein n=1 Tax=Shewanella TaxID=22 RepID=UPI000648E652|nr:MULTISPECIES: YbaY family lipoprotein [Shewanella]PZP31044.1 MAG: chaperone for general secretion pathway YbaY [Shewanella oneidensis]ASF14723.1 chaperone for general secretion pathway YbaY [Shewanella sp. FDAARGOS_354]MBW0297633.1 chaperone for general secretion pathway YbaY [Shewanella xiamenensis]MCD8560790.1 YbaY family lipoprotein [Shewanella xiamenensis]MCH7423231.1 YbaY family lipoprotein [Shewanella sp. MM_2022_3]
MLLKLKIFILFCLSSLTMTGCVTVQPEPPIIINGAAGYLEKIILPQGSEITIAIIDLNTPGAIIAQKSFNIARAPVPFKFLLPAQSIDKRINYGVVAMIKYQDKVIFQTYDRFPVINNGKYTTEVLMKAVMINQ